MEHPITPSNLGSQPGQLVPAAADDFLPPPGSWSHAIGKQVLIGAGILVAASCVWPIEETVRASGVVRPTGENVVVQSQLAGRVQQVLIHPNQRVQARQVLAVMDQASLTTTQQQLQTQLEQVQRQWRLTIQQQKDLEQESQSTALISSAQIGSSFGDVAKARATLNFAANEMRRYSELAKSGAVPVLLSQEKAARYSLAISELQQAQLGVAQQRARQSAEQAKLRQGASGLSNGLAELARQAAVLKIQLNDAERAVKNATIRAPISGSVVATSLNHAGQVLGTGEVIARIAPLQAPLEAKLLISGQEIGKIQPGQKTYLRISGCPYSDFGLMGGTVTAIAADAVPNAKGVASNQPAFEVSVQPRSKAFQNGKSRCDLRLGMDLQADVLTGRNTVMGFLLRKLRLVTQT